MARFTLPRDIYYGKGSLSQLKNLEGKKAAIVTGGSTMKKFGFLQEVENLLQAAGMETMIISGVEPDPSVETVICGAEKMKSFEPDWIVALGGGSPIDAAKAMWVFYEYPETTFEELLTPFSFPKLRKKAHFAAIPSTSGTATEVTAFSVITDYTKGIKYPLADFNITPDIAILDPDIVMTMPKKLTAYTGMDALTHAIEAYVSTAASDFTNPLALQAIKMVFKYLPDSYEGHIPSREKMHYAQCLAGMAFSNGLLGIVHSMAHKTGAVFSTGHITHGCANAMYLPYVIKYNSKSDAKEKYIEIAKAVGIEGDGDNLIDKLCDKINEFNNNFSIPTTLKEFGIDENEFLEKLPGISKNCVTDACTGSNPRHTQKEDFEKLLKCIYYGNEINF